MHPGPEVHAPVGAASGRRGRATMTYRIAISSAPAELRPALRLFTKRFPALAGGRYAPAIVFRRNAEPGPVRIEFDADGRATVSYNRPREAFRALGQLLSGALPSAPEQAPFDTFGIMWDLSRNAVPTLDYAKRVMEQLALLGYDYLMFYTEDTYQIPGEPYFGMDRGRLTAADVRALDDHAALLGIRLVPCIQTLAHLEQIFRWDAYQDVRDIDGILLAWEDKTYALVEKMLRFWTANTRSRVVHLGMDEAWRLGQGEFRKRFGEQRVFDIMTRHIDRVSALCRDLGVEGVMWSDMWFRAGSKTHNYYDLDAEVPADVAAKIPANVRLCYWDYYHDEESYYERMIARHRALHGEPLVASGVWTWGLFWYAHRITRQAAGACVRACRKVGARDLVFTMWGDDGAYCDFESAFAGLAWCAELAYAGSVDEKALETRYAALFGGASWRAVAELGEWLDNTSREILWDDPLMNLGCAARLAAAGDEIWMTDSHVRVGDIPAGVRKALRRLARTAPSRNGEGGSVPYARALATAYLARLALAEALIDAWRLPRAKRAAAVRGKALPAARKNFRAMADFAAAFRVMWTSHNRPQGLETTQIRLAGCVERAREAVLRLSDFAAGRAVTIPELDDLAEVGFAPKFREHNWARLAHGTTIA